MLLLWTNSVKLTITHLDYTLPLRVFGYSAFVHQYHPPSKFHPRPVKCVFIGYSNSQKGYKCYDPITKHLFVSRDVTFAEHEPYFIKPSTQGENWSEFQLECLLESIPPLAPIQLPTNPSNVIPRVMPRREIQDQQFDLIYSCINKHVVGPSITEDVPFPNLVKCPINNNEHTWVAEILKTSKA